MFNGNRLRIARWRKKHTAASLALESGIDSVTISRLEKGHILKPKGKTVQTLADALEWPVGFFDGDDIDELDKDVANFRSLKSMTAKDRNSALAASYEAFLLCEWMELDYDLTEPDLLDLGDVREDAELAAGMLREAWGLGDEPIENMVELLEDHGVRVFSLAVDTRKVDAFSYWHQDKPYVFLNTIKTAERGRMDAAHELAHLCLHPRKRPGQRDAEKQANAFAASFLAPEDRMYKYPPPRNRWQHQFAYGHVRSIDDLLKPAADWGIALSAMVYRLQKLGILSEWESRGFYIKIREKSSAKRGPITRRTRPRDSLTITRRPREISKIWPRIFSKVLKDFKMGKSSIAHELDIPTTELTGLTFGRLKRDRKPGWIYNEGSNHVKAFS